MKVYELAKELRIENNQIVETIGEENLIGRGQKHFRVLTDEQEAMIREKFTQPVEPVAAETQTTKEATTMPKTTKKFTTGDLIPCRCVVNHKVILLSPKTGQRYTWLGFNDVCDVDYGDLIAWKSNKLGALYNPSLMIEDEDLLSLWQKDFLKVYENFYGMDSPEEYFEIPDNEFKAFLKTAPKSVQMLITTAAMTLIKANKFNSIQKLKIIDETLGTMLTDFI